MFQFRYSLSLSLSRISLTFSLIDLHRLKTGTLRLKRLLSQDEEALPVLGGHSGPTIVLTGPRRGAWEAAAEEGRSYTALV